MLKESNLNLVAMQNSILLSYSSPCLDLSLVLHCHWMVGQVKGYSIKQRDNVVTRLTNYKNIYCAHHPWRCMGRMVGRKIEELDGNEDFPKSIAVERCQMEAKDRRPDRHRHQFAGVLPVLNFFGSWIWNPAGSEI